MLSSTRKSYALFSFSLDIVLSWIFLGAFFLIVTFSSVLNVCGRLEMHELLSVAEAIWGDHLIHAVCLLFLFLSLYITGFYKGGYKQGLVKALFQLLGGGILGVVICLIANIVLSLIQVRALALSDIGGEEFFSFVTALWIFLIPAFVHYLWCHLYHKIKKPYMRKTFVLRTHDAEGIEGSKRASMATGEETSTTGSRVHSPSLVTSLEGGEYEVVSTLELASLSADELQACILEGHISLVLVEGSSLNAREEELLRAVETLGIELRMSRALAYSPSVCEPRPDEENGVELTVYRSGPKPSVRYFIKGLFDKWVALMLLIATSPAWVFAFILIKIVSPGPVFYKQARTGLDGQPFSMWKFRTMRTDADKILDEIKKNHGNEMSGPIFKLSNDPRIFKGGNLLRKFSIDELPQLFNILSGDMSLVGPRPLPVYETEAFEHPEEHRRHAVKPGLTCFWQISGRSTITNFGDHVALDLKYVDHWSLRTDIGLLLKTVPAVLFARGAH